LKWRKFTQGQEKIAVEIPQRAHLRAFGRFFRLDLGDMLVEHIVTTGQKPPPQASCANFSE
jgi:hypothetical protein